MSFQSINKIEAAKRQLITAVDLYFLDGDPISIHALTSAAAQIIDDISKSRGLPTLMEDVFLQYVREEKRDEARKKMREPRNFFKHADQNPEGELQFNPDVNDDHLFTTASSYSMLTRERVPQMVVFEVWYLTNNPHLILDDYPYKAKILELQGNRQIPKPEYYRTGLATALEILAKTNRRTT